MNKTFRSNLEDKRSWSATDRDVPDLIHLKGQRVSRVLLVFLMTISQTVIVKDLILRLLECKSTFNGLGYLCFRGNTLGKPNFPGSVQFTLQTGR